MPCDSILHMNLRSLEIIEKIPSPHEESNVRPSESALWTIIDDKVCKLALRIIVLSTLDITSYLKKKHFNWLFLNKE